MVFPSPAARPLYFAYGSNMDPTQMAARCPSAGFRCTARLPNHRLAFSRASRKRGCGVADVVPAGGAEVWGVVYEITEMPDLAALDKAEGFVPGRTIGNSYVRTEGSVYPQALPSTPLSVHLYVAEKEPHPPPPDGRYLAQLIRGAEHWGLPEAYRRLLEALPSAPSGSP